MFSLHGECKCGRLAVEIEMSEVARKAPPRACDCDFCVERGAAYISDSQGQMRLYIREPGKLFRQKQGSETADFLSCADCGTLMAVVYQNEERVFGAVNVRVLEPTATFAPDVPVSPKKLLPEEKKSRWKEVWFRDVKIPAI